MLDLNSRVPDMSSMGDQQQLAATRGLTSAVCVCCPCNTLHTHYKAANYRAPHSLL
jgi:hypothetical protein